MAKKKIMMRVNGIWRTIETDLLTIAGYGTFMPEEDYFGEPESIDLTFRTCNPDNQFNTKPPYQPIGEYLRVKRIVTYLADGGTCSWVLQKGFVQPPTRLVIVNPPTKLVYANDEDIDFTGMVVKAQYDDGTFWMDADHQDGIIPIEELELTVKKAHTANPSDWTADSLLLSTINMDLGTVTINVYNVTASRTFIRVNYGKCIGAWIYSRTTNGGARQVGPVLISRKAENTWIQSNGINSSPRAYVYDGTTWYYNSDLVHAGGSDVSVSYTTPLDRVADVDYGIPESALFNHIMEMAGPHAVYTPQTIPVGWTFHDQSGNEITLTNQFNIEVD